MAWKNIKVRHEDGRTGTITCESPGFMHVGLHITGGDGSKPYVQLNADGKDSGEKGWSWHCADFDPAAGGARWLPLGDHNTPEFVARIRAEAESAAAAAARQQRRRRPVTA